MVLRDENGAIVQNTYETIVTPEYDQHQGSVTTKGENGRGNGSRTKDDIYYTIDHCSEFSEKEKKRIGGPNDEIIKALVDMQDTYGIDPLWALAVAHGESHCGTAYPESEHRFFNISPWDGIKGSNGTSSGFAIYKSDEDAIMDFGNYAENCFTNPLTNVDEFEFCDGKHVFENAKKKYYPTYLKLKTILSGKGV